MRYDHPYAPNTKVRKHCYSLTRLFPARFVQYNVIGCGSDTRMQNITHPEVGDDNIRRYALIIVKDQCPDDSLAKNSRSVLLQTSFLS